MDLAYTTWLTLFQMSGPHPRFCVAAVYGCSMMHQEPVPVARRSTLSTLRTLAAFCLSWSSMPRRIRAVSNQIGAERMAVAHAGTDFLAGPVGHIGVNTYFRRGLLAVNASDNTGLGLFDDTASAVGNFPTALRGYDRTAVDDYVRTLEESVVKSRRHSAQLEQQVTVLQDELTSAGDRPDKDVDYANLGGRANDILRLAQEQARELVQNATVEAEKLKEQARREADGLRSNAAREGDAIKTGGAAQIDQLRAQVA